MAAARSSPEEITLKTLAVCLSTLLLTCAKAGGVNIDRLTDQDVDHLLDNSCVLVGIEPAVPELLDTLTQLASIYGDDKQVVSVGTIAKYYFLGPSKSQLRVKSVSGTVAPIGELYEGADLLLFKRRVKDRTCLIHPAHIRAGPVGEIPSGPRTLRALVDLINEGCNGFRDMDGRYTVAGHHRNHILNNLFHVQMISNISMGLVADSLISSNRTNVELNLFTSLKNIPSTFQTQGRCFQSGMNSACHILDVFTENPEFDMKVTHSKEPKFSKSKKSACDVLSYSPSTEHFFHEYLKRSRPFIVRNITSSWPAFKKWTNNFLRSEFGKNNVHVKLTPSGDYEGVESSKLWENYETFKIPTEVRSQLKFPDLVTVRPAGVNMNFSDFLDLVERAAREGVEERKVSAYLEYSSIPDYMPALEADIIEPRFTKDLLKRSHLNLWLSDGHTLGRLHFDQYDNVLCQVGFFMEEISIINPSFDLEDVSL